MRIQVNEKAYLQELNCAKIELNSKPSLMAKTINTEDTLVVVVDMVVGFCKEGALCSPRNEKIISDIKVVLDALPNAQKVFIRDCHDENSVEFKSYPHHCHNKKESALVSEFSKYGGFDVPKNSTNGFFALCEKLPSVWEYKNIVLVGVCSDICVMQLALTLKGYADEKNLVNNIIVLTDCVETYDAPTHNADLQNMFALKFMEQAGIGLFKDIK